MPPGPFHEYYIDELENAFQSVGIPTKRNVATRRGRKTGYGDLLAVLPHCQLLVEVELTTARITNDLRKRQEISADAILWIVVPNTNVARAVKQSIPIRKDLNARRRTFVFTFASAMQRILAKNDFCFDVIGQNKTKN